MSILSSAWNVNSDTAPPVFWNYENINDVVCSKIVKYSVVTSGIDIDKEVLSKIGGWSLISVTTILM